MAAKQLSGKEPVAHFKSCLWSAILTHNLLVIGGPEVHLSKLTVVLPTLNAGESLAATLAVVAKGDVAEVIVADGGSSDDTRAIVAAAGARWVSAPRGRGPQLVAGAQAAQGDWLLFLHADTQLQAGWAAEAAAFMANTGDGERAAAFAFALDDLSPAARRLERMVAWRGRVLGLPYGDQGLLISATFYRALGGYAKLPLMEDVDIVRRIGRHRISILGSVALTAAGRYRRDGYVLRPARNLLCLALYFCGVPTAWLARLYA